MKKRVFGLLLSVVMIFALVIPAMAAGEDDATYQDGGSKAAETGEAYVYDVYGLLTEDEWDDLEWQAEKISKKYECGVYIVTVDDYRDYGSSVYEAAKAIYTEAGFGWGSGKDGELLLLSMDDRDYYLIAYGFGNTAFTDYGKERMEDEFLDNFGENDWYSGFSDYLNISERYLQLARDGKPVDVGRDPDHIDWAGILIRAACIIFIPVITAGVVVGIFWGQMKSVRVAGTAAEYVVPGGLDVQVSEDVYTHTTVNRVHIQRDNDSGGTSVDSSGFSGSSGKF